MTNIYNKGRYRSNEWAKHLRPFLKKKSNRRWRKHADKLMEQDLFGDEKISSLSRKRRNIRDKVEVEFVVKSFWSTYTTKSKYRSLRSAKDAMSRKNVVEARIID